MKIFHVYRDEWGREKGRERGIIIIKWKRGRRTFLWCCSQSERKNYRPFAPRPSLPPENLTTPHPPKSLALLCCQGNGAGKKTSRYSMTGRTLVSFLLYFFFDVYIFFIFYFMFSFLPNPDFSSHKAGISIIYLAEKIAMNLIRKIRLKKKRGQQKKWQRQLKKSAANPFIKR